MTGKMYVILIWPSAYPCSTYEIRTLQRVRQRHNSAKIRWQHRLKRERPTGTELKNRSPKVRMEKDSSRGGPNPGRIKDQTKFALAAGGSLSANLGAERENAQ